MSELYVKVKIKIGECDLSKFRYRSYFQSSKNRQVVDDALQSIPANGLIQRSYDLRFFEKVDGSSVSFVIYSPQEVVLSRPLFLELYEDANEPIITNINLPTSMCVTSTDENNTQQVKIKYPNRPRWSLVFEGYPKVLLSNGSYDDEDADQIFSRLFDAQTIQTYGFHNACATRVSLGLINGKMRVYPGFNINLAGHALRGKSIEVSARNLRKQLTKRWSQKDGKKADIVIPPSDTRTIASVASEINGGGVKNGIYIIEGGFGGGVSGHATLWIGSESNVVGKHHYVDYEGTIYFWELN